MTQEKDALDFDRNTRSGFKKYIELNPFYFESIFPGVDVGRSGGSFLAISGR
jgi:hypothetical protein